MAIHSDLTGAAALHQIAHHSETDPTSTLGAYKVWVKDSTGVMKIRNAANSAWITVTSPNHNLFSSSHPDVDAADTPANGEVLTYDGTASKWKSTALPSASTPGHAIKDEGGSALAQRANLNFIGSGVTASDNSGTGATDVTIPGATGGSTDLEGLSDVDLTSPATRQGLFYDGTNFVNQYEPAHFVATQSKTATFTASLAEHTYLCDATGGAFTANLPTAVGCAGKQFVLKKTDSSANAITLDPNGSQTIDGFSTFAIDEERESLAIYSDNANWRILAHPYGGADAYSVPAGGATDEVLTKLSSTSGDYDWQAPPAQTTRKFLNLGNVTATSTPGSALYIGATFRPTMDGLTLKGVRFRDASNVNGVSYTLYLYNITSGVVSVASKAFTGNGTFQQVDFDTPQALTSGQIYELGFGTASAANMRYSGTSGNNIASTTVTEDFLGTSSGTLSAASNGTTSRTTSGGVAPNIRVEYTVA